jgi:hypothetical protein
VVARSVLRLADQAAGRYPTQCVLTGVTSSRAVRMTAPEWEGPRWLLAVPGLGMLIGIIPGRRRCSVALPVSATTWKRWSRRQLVGVAAIGFGAMIAIGGAVGGEVSLVLLGALVAVAGAGYLTVVAHRFWVVCRYRPADGTVIVEPTHPKFDAAARALFVRSL